MKELNLIIAYFIMLLNIKYSYELTILSVFKK